MSAPIGWCGTPYAVATVGDENPDHLPVLRHAWRPVDRTHSLSSYVTVCTGQWATWENDFDTEINATITCPKCLAWARRLEWLADV